MNMDVYKKIIKEKLTPKRYEHSIRVSEEAVKLAKKYGADSQKAEIAGILHDIMKDTDYDDQLKIIKEFGIILNNVEKFSKKLWHAISGSLYIKNILGIQDDDIINSVRYHTTSRPNMSTLEKVIFIADFTSSDRDYNGVEEMRIAASKSLEVAMEEGLAFTIGDLSSKRLPIDENTFLSYNQIILNKEGS